MKDLLYLKDEQIKEFIQLLYYAYRETFSDPKEILSKNSTETKNQKLKNSKKEIGIRIPDNNIPRKIVKDLGNPIATTSVKNKEMLIEYSIDPELIYEHFNKLVDIVIDGGYGEAVPSTILDCTNNTPEIIRKGKEQVMLKKATHDSLLILEKETICKRTT